MSPVAGVFPKPGATSATSAAGHEEAAAARLRIHACQPAHFRLAAELKALWQCWLAGDAAAASAPGATRLRVEAAAEPGRRLFALSNPSGTVELTVGPGAYHITLFRGQHERRYTVTLEPGTTFDLDLHDAIQAD